MIQYTYGDILTDPSEALVNPVNCVGVMGRGLAKQFKKAYPANFKAYQVEHETNGIRRIFTFDRLPATHPRYIINFPTKDHWKGTSHLEYITKGLKDLVDAIEQLEIKSIAIPTLGCGLGDLHWEDVRFHLEAALLPLLTVRITLYQPETHLHTFVHQPEGILNGWRRIMNDPNP